MFLFHASETSTYTVIIHILFCWILAPFYEKFFQFSFKEAIVSNLFYVTREFIIEITACISWLTVTKFKLLYVLMTVWAVSCIISMYLTICYTCTFPFTHKIVFECTTFMRFVFLDSQNFLDRCLSVLSLQYS